jgi:hypothetical protein
MHEHLFVFRKPQPGEDLGRIRYSVWRPAAQSQPDEANNSPNFTEKLGQFFWTLNIISGKNTSFICNSVQMCI